MDIIYVNHGHYLRKPWSLGKPCTL